MLPWTTECAVSSRWNKWTSIALDWTWRFRLDGISLREWNSEILWRGKDDVVIYNVCRWQMVQSSWGRHIPISQEWSTVEGSVHSSNVSM